MEKTFQTGSFSFRLRFPEELVLPADMEKFAVEKESADYTYTITIVDTLPEAEGELLVNRVDLQVFRNGEGLESRLIGVKGEERPYALYRETAQKHAQVFVGRWYLDGVAKYEVVFLSLLALERRLSERPCLILHCAYLEYQGKAMLFSAPSGTGKTTQAGLWEQYRGSRTVNGDKALLEYDGKTWTANGWPVCGTSEVCENKKLPIGCIVMLSQAKLNQAWRLRPAEAFTSLYGQITMNRWEREGLVKNLDLLERLVGKVPIYHLACDISEDAVKTLEQELMRDSSEEAAAAAFLQKKCDAENGEKSMRLVDTRAYVGMLKELVEQGKEVRMVISGSSMAPFLIHGRDSIFFRAPERELRKGDIVFYERPGGQFVVHRICGVHGESYDLIGDGQTEIEHNVRREQIFARVTQVERKGKRLAPGSFWWGFFEKVWIRMIPLRPMGNRIYRLLQGKRPAHRENEREKT